MFLKRLEVKGFKSFAEQVNVEFVPGVTAVVGPNGSGKSNISDSIRWVLGEQSAKSLRGSKMEDIIFAGSDSRKSVNLAEVSLVLDNEDQHLNIDFSEVSVTRRVYRSGESEYLINRQPCRLKDIVELFLDSGLGREAYSIIGQGKIEEILSSKSEDRRLIFEEAAGVLKYKTRKIQAEKRLNETQENLNRVEDILHELEAQVEPLREQSSIAKEYLEAEEKRKKEDITITAAEISDLHTRWTEAKEKLEQYKGVLEQQAEQIKKSEEAIATCRAQSKSVAEALQATQEQRLVVSEELEKKEGRRGVLQERKKNAAQNSSQLKEDIEQTEHKLTSAREAAEKQNELLKNEKAILHTRREKLRSLEGILSGSGEEMQEKLEQLKADYIEVLNEQASIRNEQRYLEEQKRQQTHKHERLLNENKESKAQRNEITDKLNQAKADEKEKASALKDLEQKEAQLVTKQSELEESYQQNETKLYEAYRILQKTKSRAEAVREMESDFSGFFQGVKEILKERNSRLMGIHGAVAELIRTEKQHELAIETALGGAAQHIVVEEEQHAREAIRFLKQKRLGRATFLPLSTVKPRYIQPAQLQLLTNEAEFIGVATDLITFEAKVSPAITNLLGSIVIAKDLPGANKLASKTGHRFRIVTLDGDVVNPGGSMTGGSVKQKNSSLVGRKRELEELDAQTLKIEQGVYQLEQRISEKKTTRASLREELAQLQQMTQRHRTAWQESQSTVRELELTSASVEKQFLRMDREEMAAEKEQETVLNRLDELQHNLTQATEKQEKWKLEIERLEEQFKQQQSSRETVQEELVGVRISEAESKQSVKHVSEQAEHYKQEILELKSNLTNLKEEYELLISAMNEGSNGEEQLSEQISYYQREKEQAKHKLDELEKQRNQLDQQYAELEEVLKQNQQRYSYAHDEYKHQDVRMNRLDVDLEHRLEKLRIEYEISFEAATEQYPLSGTLEDAKTRLKLLKLTIDELGPVNIGSIEEFERVHERYSFLLEQQQDLLEAKETLHQVISEMDEEMSNRFEDTFSQVRGHFQEVYRKLFGGGEADLVLTEPGDILRTGVDIMARPPGKKLQHLALLSGGERALTAIALLFSILKVRPVPFCVLDEVEAALDEANVSRFAQYLKDFSSATQFIVITHRSGTMEEADVLYGVTMQESGVSRLVSVRLEETKELIES
ncbi:chromosome segregation protein SMC [Alkalicoccobacillus porphyridii]|uniref:Chromosome partition protein Smc n=1 Tax=Alkalicoccobacillus porphyridii TaxID=2597270 RepID=A0A553ZY57_9BACI|nr:chromosome segregation protein SMC [Alkalicoccobacillus porphyridii]TSB46379.1 chromosome segregation protein SMC [Alkalicoccobacillus porphyridii]